MVLFERVVLAVFATIPVINCAVFFPSNSAYGIFAAIAVPLDLGPHRNVFVSYNFEANYNLPINWQIPTYLNIGEKRLIQEKKTEEENDSKSTSLSEGIGSTLKNNTSTSTNEEETKEHKNPQKRSLLSRRIFYEMLKQKLEMHGYNGESCLLRIICESNISGLGDVNGILGSIFHIIFAPSTSKNEELPDIYYKAEIENPLTECTSYQEKCPENILGFISKQMEVNIGKIKE